MLYSFTYPLLRSCRPLGLMTVALSNFFLVSALFNILQLFQFQRDPLLVWISPEVNSAQKNWLTLLLFTDKRFSGRFSTLGVFENRFINNFNSFCYLILNLSFRQSHCFCCPYSEIYDCLSCLYLDSFIFSR